MHPNTLKLDMSGLFPNQSSYGVAFLMALLGLRLWVYTDVATASAQNLSGSFEWINNDRTDSIMVRLSLSATPFCSGMYGFVNWCAIPFSAQNFLNSFDVVPPRCRFGLFEHNSR